MFIQTGGTNTIRRGLDLGTWGSSDLYELSGTGALSAKYEYVGAMVGPGTFLQSGGTNTATYLEVRPSGRYELTGGSLRIAGGLDNKGTLDFGGGTGAIQADNAIVKFVAAPLNTGSATLTITGNSLLIVPTGFDPGAAFGTYGNAGPTHIAGTTLTVPPGQAISGWGSIDDYVECGGTIAASADGDGFLGLSLYGGVMVSGTGNVSLGDGTLSVNAPGSGISAGALSARSESIGSQGTGTFTQMGGTNTVNNFLYVGYSSGSSGRYELSGTGALSARNVIVGREGTGIFRQSGGSNWAGHLYLGYYPGSKGTYTISGGVLSAARLYVGYSGQGTLDITGPGAQVDISSLLRFGPKSVLVAGTGATFHMTGADFENTNTVAADLAGLSNLTLSFEGGAGVTDDFEVAGQDFGAVAAGWTDNFAVGSLQLGTGTAVGAGRIRLVDEFDNQQDGGLMDEALYTGTLVLNAGAKINRNGLRLYYLNGGDPKEFFPGDAKLDGNVDVLDLTVFANNFGAADADWSMADFNGDGAVDVLDLTVFANNFGSITGDAGQSVPEPATALLLALGGLTLVQRRRWLTASPLRPVLIGPVHAGLPAVQALCPSPHDVREGLAAVLAPERLFGLPVVVATARAAATPAAGGLDDDHVGVRVRRALGAARAPGTASFAVLGLGLRCHIDLLL